MLSVKELIKSVGRNSLEDLIDMYKEPTVLNDTDELYEEIRLQSFGVDKFVLGYFYDYSKGHAEANVYDTVKQMWKDVVFKVVDGKNEVLYVEMANNHASFEGKKIRIS